jgi:transposase
MPGRNHTREFKLAVVRQIMSGEKGPAQVCREHKLADSVLSRWRKQYAERGEAAFQGESAAELAALKRRVADLERLVGRTVMENDVLKKALEQAHSHHRNGMG